MTIRHLNIFNTVCDYGSITAAAEKLNMAQPAVSTAIKELESFYCTKLFDRMHRRIYLTESGELLRRYSSIILEQFDEAAEVLRDQTKSARCSFGVNVSVGETFLPAMLHKLRAEIPNIALGVIVDNTHCIEEKLNGNEIDFCIVDNLSEKAGRVVIPIYTNEMAVVCAPDYTDKKQIAVEELADFDLLMHEDNSGNRICTDAVFHTHGMSVRPTVVSTSNFSLIHLAKSGLGVTILPRDVVKSELESGSLREIEISNAEFVRHYFIAFNEKKYLTGTVKKVISILIEPAEKTKAPHI